MDKAISLLYNSCSIQIPDGNMGWKYQLPKKLRTAILRITQEAEHNWRCIEFAKAYLSCLESLDSEDIRILQDGLK